MAHLDSSSGGCLKNPRGKIIFDKYELGRLLGYGAFAKVYQAKNIKTGEYVAIKAIDKDVIVKQGLESHIKREISSMHRLRHPHIVELYEVLATRSRIYFVMELQKNGELFHLVCKGHLSEDACRKYFTQLMSAVHFCHSRGIFHRDLKLENLLLNENGDLKVSDFGLSTLWDQIQNNCVSHTVCGTPAYVSPEVLSRRAYDPAKSDIWSCGVILFAINAGYLPFNEANLMNTYRKIYKAQFRFPKWLSPPLRQLIRRILDPKPETRISIDQITRHPWFSRAINFKDPKLNAPTSSSISKPSPTKLTDMNAFELLASLSSGLDLSGLFHDSERDVLFQDHERFVSSVSGEIIMQKVADMVKEQRLVMRKKGWTVEIEDNNNNLILRIEVFGLGKGMIVVDVKRTTAADAPEYDRFWRAHLRPAISSIA